MAMALDPCTDLLEPEIAVVMEEEESEEEPKETLPEPAETEAEAPVPKIPDQVKVAINVKKAGEREMGKAQDRKAEIDSVAKGPTLVITTDDESEPSCPEPEPEGIIIMSVDSISTALDSDSERQRKPPPRRSCLNPTCSARACNLPLASSMERYYYGHEKETIKTWICPPCAQRVKEYLQDVVTALKERRPVCAVPTPFRGCPKLVLDLIDEDDHESESGSAADPVRLDDAACKTNGDTAFVLPPGLDVKEAIDACIASLDLDTQKRIYKEWLEEQVKAAESSFASIEADANRMHTALLELTNILNKNRRPHYQVKMLPPIEIETATEGINKEAIQKIANRIVCRRRTSGIPKSSTLALVRALRESHSQPHGSSVFDLDSDVIPLKRHKSVAARRLELEPTNDRAITRPYPRPGDRMYVMSGSVLEPWVLGTVVDVRQSLFALLEYEVRLDPDLTADASGYRKRPGPETLLVSGKRLAYPQSLSHVVPVGTRVVAPFIDRMKPPLEESDTVDVDSSPGGSATGGAGSQYYAGVVAETPATQNRFRYLIFFDDGYAEYVSQHGLLLVSDSSPQVWADVYPDTQDFVREYLRRFPERRLVRLTRGSITTIEWNRRAFAARVLDVDASMVKIYFEISGRIEWVYRGSNRFDKSLWEAEGVEVDANGYEKPASTAATEGNFATANTMNLPNSQPPTIMNTANLIEYEGKLIRLTLPSSSEGVRITILRPMPYSEHECRPGCAAVYDPQSPLLVNVNPLLHPMYLGWDREVARASPRRIVYYRAPCGLRLRDPDEVQSYVYKTHCRLGIDLFSFDAYVEPYAEFVPSVQLYHNPDLSYGKEMVAVSCVNSISEQPPDYIEYTPRRLPGKGVRINTEKEFLVCCDCTDDCLDKEKCACWQLTLEGTELTPGPPPDVPIGYQQRRLGDHVTSGIYECNKHCKCRSTCSNRVVQHGLRWKLQVFKTRTKGWAIRPLQDIPSGSFICVYAGQLLHENTANEDGLNYGDEYFAELDYMEATEQQKEGFEEEVVDPGGASPQPKLRTRQLFGADEQVYVMDAKTIGNIGRYMNHSCYPNVFVQNVFVDTHDLRFPWVAFFAYNLIRAGTELTWDYSYQAGSVMGKVMYCYCGSEECRGRLL